MKLRTALICSIMVPGAVHAATVDITVRGSDGKPLVDAVVMLDSPKKPAGPIRFPWRYDMAQQDIAFQPHVLIVPVGTTVAFPNHDKVRHHVYSFSKTKKFDLKLYGRDETRSITFEKVGPVALGCNIHDRMSGFVMVVDTPYAMKSDAAGHVTIANVPAGPLRVRVWHPAIRAPGNQLGQAITLAEPRFATTLTVRTQ